MNNKDIIENKFPDWKIPGSYNNMKREILTTLINNPNVKYKEIEEEYGYTEAFRLSWNQIFPSWVKIREFIKNEH